MYNKIQFKIIALITLVTAFFIFGLFSLRKSETRNISMLLRDRVSEKDTIIRQIINLKSKSLLSYTFDYSYWDEMMNFTKSPDDKWVYENLVMSLPTFNVNAVWIYNKDLNLIYTTNNLENRTFRDLPLSKEDLKSIVSRDLFAHFYINTSPGLMEISIAPLQPSYDNNRVTPPQGYYIGGRLWTPEYITDLSKLTSSKMSIVSNIKDTLTENELGEFEFINDIHLQDWSGANLAKIRAITDSPVFDKFFSYSFYQFIGTIVFIVLIIILISMYLFRIVNIPLKAITGSLESGNKEKIDYLLKKKNEFGDISRLIAESFQYKESLLEEISMRKKAEEELIKQKEKAEEMSRLKSNLLANLSHEFRTPLSGIIGISELLKDEIRNTEQNRLLNDITISGRRLHDTLNSILLLAQFESSQIVIYKETFNIAEEFQKSINILRYKADEKDLELKVIIEDKDIFVETDKELLKQVFYNIFDNATKFTDTGSITIKFSSKKEKEQYYSLINIIDTGIGISESNIKLIFEEFKQVSEGYGRKFEGAGLGLSLTKKILNMLNGSISCKSEQGVGSIFTITIPATKMKTEIKTEPVTPEVIAKPVSEKSLNILFVEDNASNQFIFEKFLNDIANVDFANNGIDAMDNVKEKNYDIIFMDINLGAGLDGCDTMKEIRKINNYNTTPFVALTGYAMEHDRDYFLSNGFDYFMMKPFNKNDLTTIVGKISEKITNNKS